MKKLFFHVLIICAGIIFPAFGTQPYEIRVSGISPVMFLEIWDYEAEDHDRVEIRMNGDRITEFEIKNQKQTISVPLVFEDDSTEVLVEIIGTFDGGGGVTYAVRAIGLGTDTGVYRHGSAVGSGNAYRIIKEQDLLTDIWHWMFGEETDQCFTDEAAVHSGQQQENSITLLENLLGVTNDILDGGSDEYDAATKALEYSIIGLVSETPFGMAFNVGQDSVAILTSIVLGEFKEAGNIAMESMISDFYKATYNLGIFAGVTLTDYFINK